MNGSSFMFNWPLSITGFTKRDIPSSGVIFLFLLYPISIYSGYALALMIFKKHNRNISKESKSYEDVKSRKDLPKNMKFEIVRYPDYGKGVHSLRDAVRMAISDIDQFVKEGDRVLIKVNICGGIPDNRGTFTSPEVVKYVVEMVREKTKNTIIICDADMIWTKFWENARAIGWLNLDWVEWRSTKFDNVKPQLVNLSETELVYFNFGEGSVFQDNERPNEEVVSAEMLKADVIISVPKMKTHLLTGVTLGMKNMYGTFPEEDKARYHQRGINEVIYWVNYAFPPNLTLIDGNIGGEAIGPLSVTPILSYNTIISSESAPIADAVASKLIGYDDPFEDIEHLKLTRVKELSRPADQMVLLSGIIPEELERPATELIKDRHLPENQKDGNWARPAPEVANKYEYLMENILTIPGIDTFFNIGADFILFDLARIPLLKYFNEAILNFLYEAPRFWATKTTETNLSNRDRRINLAIFSLVSIISLHFFATNNYLSKSHLESAQWFILGFALAIILGGWFAWNMKTKNMVGITLASMVVALFVESIAPSALWWTYHYENDTFPNYISIIYNYQILSRELIAPNIPYYPLFSIPIFIITIIGISYFILKPIFAYVDLKGERFKLVPFAAIMIFLSALLYLEGYLNGTGKMPTNCIITIYIVLGVLGFYYNQKHSLDWNLSIAIAAVVLGGTMEFMGAIAGFWGYPLTLHTWQRWQNLTTINQFAWLDPIYFPPFTRLPLFLSLTWALNIWAACGLAQILEIDMRHAFSNNGPDELVSGSFNKLMNKTHDKKKKDELIKRKNKILEIIKNEHVQESKDIRNLINNELEDWTPEMNESEIKKFISDILKSLREQAIDSSWYASMVILAVLEAEENLGIKQEEEVKNLVQNCADWLKNEQNRTKEGLWGSSLYHRGISNIFDTSLALVALKRADSANDDLIQDMAEYINVHIIKDYWGWPSIPGGDIEVGATSWAAIVLKEYDIDKYSSNITKAIEWLKFNQRDDGGWSVGYKDDPTAVSLITRTYDAVEALLSTGISSQSAIIKNAVNWVTNLQRVRNVNGKIECSWESDLYQSDIGNSACALIILLRCGQDPQSLEVTAGIDWLLKRKAEWKKTDLPRIIICLSLYFKYRKSGPTLKHNHR